jgi:tetratricopeptide (TPR) repeat protein
LRRYAQQYFIVEKPSFGDNLAYMLQYQFGYMYWRYFMWNFAGRQNDVQGKYDDFNGNWISGIPFIDEWHLGMSQDNLPTDVLDNKARNTYYLLPLLLGLVGFFFLLHTDKKRFWVLLVFFLMTGLAIQFYTNIRPFEPRERDYSVVGSFYVFAIWIGFGVYGLFDLFQEKIKSKWLAPALTVLCLVLVPGILAANNWDDHDRSGKYTANAMARKYLESCAPNSILFTIGDNDSFPLWYLQEIEGVRTDVRVVNTSLFQTDWYIDQMKRKAYESEPIPSQLTHKQYRGSTRDVIIYREISEKVAKDTLDIKRFMDFVSSEEPSTKLKFIVERRGEDPRVYPKHLLNSNYFPSRNIRVPVDKNAVLRNGIVKPKDSAKIEDNLYLRIDGSYIYKNRLLMLDIIANNNWERPIYFSGGAFSDEDYIWLKDYLQLDGMCYKLVPIKTPVDRANPYDMGRVDADLMYDLVTSWDWGGSGEDIYHDIETRRNGITYRGNLARLIEQLINEDKLDKAEEIADLAMEKMPVDTFGFYSLLEPYISTYFEVGNRDKARNLFKEVARKYQENLMYLSSQPLKTQERLIEDIYTDIQRYRALVDVLVVYDNEDFVLEETKKFNSYLQLFDPLMGPSEEEPMPSDDIDINALLNDSSSAIAPEED